MTSHKTILITGGAGFIGSNFIRIAHEEFRIVNIDALTYAGNEDNLESLAKPQNYTFVKGNICDSILIADLLERYEVSAVIHFAAESHVDRSIDSPEEFIHANIYGTFELLEASRQYLKTRDESFANKFRFVHISTDEVFGSLGPLGYFNERSNYAPNSPYAASKASADHLVRSYFHTYALPTLTTNCSNNYGPFQFPEKLIPLMILNALEGKPLPVYGDGKNQRDWIHVEDHCQAILRVLEAGVPGETYAIGARCEKRNIDIVHDICNALESVVPSVGLSYKSLIRYVTDRPGHDRRYSIDPTKIERELRWSPKYSFSDGIRQTVKWYVEHPEWCERISSGQYQRERLGVST